MNDHPQLTDDDLREFIALTAVGELDADEVAELDTVLAGRPDLQAELADLREAAATMAFAVSEPPQPALRSIVMDAIANEAQTPLVSAVERDMDVTTTTADDTVVPFERPAGGERRRRSNGWMVGALSAAAATVLVIGGAVIARRGDDGGSVANGPVAAVLDDPKHVAIRFDGELADLAMIYSAEHGALVVSGTSIALPAGDNVYELWLIVDDAPAAVTTFRPDSGGTVEALVEDVEVAEDATYAITVEPAGGSEQPTTDPIAQTSS